MRQWQDVTLTTFSHMRQSHLKRLVKGTLLGLRQFLATGTPLKVMRNVFYFTLKALYVLKIFQFLFWFFGQVEKRVLGQLPMGKIFPQP